MWIVRLALRRPYTFVVAALVLVLMTPYVLLRTPTDIFPAINIPVISVIWQYNGLNAREIEQRILYNHERSLSATVNDIEHVESNAYNGVGIIKVFLHEGASVDAGVAQITAIAQTILRQMPPGQTPPLIIRYNASTVPILQYGLSSKTLSEQELYDLGQNQVRVNLAMVQGAQIPWPYGGKTRLVSVDLDLDALKAKGLAAQDVVDAFNAQNLILPSGTAKIGSTEYDVEVDGSPRVLEELNQLPIRVVNGATIRLQDVAQVRDGAQPQVNIVRQDGKRGALLTILKSGKASTLDVVARVKAAMPAILTGLPAALDIREFADQSVFVRAAVEGVVKEGFIAASLTALMILLFIGSWRSTIIIAISIPLSILASLAALSALGQTINLMTLGGLALAVGVLVDDATVEIENVHRQMAMGKPLQEAILDGAQEIALPAFVSTLCICIVFVPMFFLTGVAKYLFVPLAQAVVFAMLASYALSRTLVPTLVMWFYRNAAHWHGGESLQQPGWARPFIAIQNAFEAGFARLRESYRCTLAGWLCRRGLMISLVLVFCAATGLLLPFLGEDFFRPWMPDVLSPLPRPKRNPHRGNGTPHRRGGSGHPGRSSGGRDCGNPGQHRHSHLGHQPQLQHQRADGGWGFRHTGFIETGSWTDGRLRSKTAQPAQPGISRSDVLFPAGRHREPDAEFWTPGAVRHPVRRPGPGREPRRRVALGHANPRYFRRGGCAGPAAYGPAKTPGRDAAGKGGRARVHRP